MSNEAGKYSSIDEESVSTVVDREQTLLLGQRSHPRPLVPIIKGLVAIAFFIGVGFLLAVAFFSVGSKAPTQAETEAPFTGAVQSVRDCTFGECYASGCNKATSPYTCIYGGPGGGCSATPFIEGGTCADQCNLGICDSLDIPEDYPSCEGVACGEDWCKIGQKCGPTVQYQCMQGSSRYGCSDDKLAWTLRTSGSVCSECCDITTCTDTELLSFAGTVQPVRDCTFDECYASMCNKATSPYTCIDGGPGGGCSATPFIEGGTCADQCNLSICDSLDIPEDYPSCEGVACGEDWCKIGQLCGPAVQYQCTQGSSRYGCSDDKLAWTLRTSGSVCSDCCDITTCSDTELLSFAGTVQPVRDCTFDECYASMCNKATSPYTCIHGGPGGGCSATPFIEGGTCADQCNLGICDSLDIPEDYPSCEGVACGEDWCKIGQLCGPAVQYQCTQGSSRYGCSDDKLAWTLRTSGSVCSECCDITTCN